MEYALNAPNRLIQGNILNHSWWDFNPLWMFIKNPYIGIWTLWGIMRWVDHRKQHDLITHGTQHLRCHVYNRAVSTWRKSYCVVCQLINNFNTKLGLKKILKIRILIGEVSSPYLHKLILGHIIFCFTILTFFCKH